MLERRDAEQVFSAPFVSAPMRVEPAWIDYNGHLNMAYYNVLFDRAVDEVYELIGLPDRMETTRPWRETFEHALKEFQRRNFDAADAGFRCALEMRPNDGPANFYLRQTAELRSQPPGQR